jgi:hypothetical protein
LNDRLNQFLSDEDREILMRTIALLAATAILLSAPCGLALAQSAPDSGTAAAPATTAPAAPAAPAAQTPPASAPAPAAQQSATPPASTAPANAPAATADNEHKAKKKKTAGGTRRREIEKSIDSGTVPSRYRSAVPKEYQQYIPFSKD